MRKEETRKTKRWREDGRKAEEEKRRRGMPGARVTDRANEL